MNLENKVIEKLSNIYDPEIPVDIYNLGLIYDIGFEQCSKGYYCNILMTFTSPACPVADFLMEQINFHVGHIRKIYKVEITVTFDPPWSSDKITEEGRLLFEIENIEI